MPFDVVYNDAQRDGLYHAWAVRKIRPASRIRTLAAAGELTTGTGEVIPPFDAPDPSIRDIGKRMDRARIKRVQATQGDAPDPLQAVRAGILSTVQFETDRIDAALRRGKLTEADANRAITRLRELARVAREAAALPTALDPNPVAPGDRQPGAAQDAPKAPGRPVVGGLVAAIAAEHGHPKYETRTTTTPPPDEGKPTSDKPEHASSDAHTTTNQDERAAQQTHDPVPAGLS